MDETSKLSIKVKVPVTSNAVYAVNKDGDFGKASVREKNWPSNAEKKQSVDEINKGNSTGAKRFEDYINRVIQLGEMPRGLAVTVTNATNSNVDSGMGVVAIPTETVDDAYKKRMADISKAIEFSKNHVSVIPEHPKAVAITDQNADAVKAKEHPIMKLEVADGVPNVIHKGNGIINLPALENKTLMRLD